MTVDPRSCTGRDTPSQSSTCVKLTSADVRQVWELMYGFGDPSHGLGQHLPQIGLSSFYLYVRYIYHISSGPGHVLVILEKTSLEGAIAIQFTIQIIWSKKLLKSSNTEVVHI